MSEWVLPFIREEMNEQTIIRRLQHLTSSYLVRFIPYRVELESCDGVIQSSQRRVIVRLTVSSQKNDYGLAFRLPLCAAVDGQMRWPNSMIIGFLDALVDFASDLVKFGNCDSLLGIGLLRRLRDTSIPYPLHAQLNYYSKLCKCKSSYPPDQVFK